MIGKISIEIEGIDPTELDVLMSTIDTLIITKTLAMKDGSAELFFDDVGLVQQIIFRKKAKKRDGQELEIRPVLSGTATSHFDLFGKLQKIIYETVWRRNKPSSIVDNYKSVKVNVLRP